MAHLRNKSNFVELPQHPAGELNGLGVTFPEIRDKLPPERGRHDALQEKAPAEAQGSKMEGLGCLTSEEALSSAGAVFRFGPVGRLRNSLIAVGLLVM